MRDNQVWMTPDGEPIEGMTPARLISHNVQATPLQISMAGSALARFNDERRLSLAGGGFYAVGGELADGTKFRIVSINNVVKVEIWPKTTTEEEELGVTFWCQPWDADWVAVQYAEAFTIPQWYVIDDLDSDDTNDSPDFLQALTRNETYEEIGDGRYPGNQTWMAPPGHPSTGLVISWWGPMRRYSNTLLDNTIDAAGIWMRTPSADGVFSSAPLFTPLTAPTGGIAGALNGQMFNTPGYTELVPAITVEPVHTPPAGTRFVWLNGKILYLPADFIVSSACLGYRSGKPVVRATGFTFSTLRVIEQSTTVEEAWNVLADLEMRAASLGVPHPHQRLNTSGVWVNQFSDWQLFSSLSQPFYWNADGTEAMGMVYIGRDNDGTTTVGTHVLVTVSVTDVSCSVSSVEYPADLAEGRIDIDGVGGTAIGSSTNVIRTDSEYTAVLAADYKGNAPMILRTHITLDYDRNESYDRTLGVIPQVFDFEYPDGGGTGGTIPSSFSWNDIDATEDHSTNETSLYSSWASLNETELTGTRENRSMSFSSVLSRTENKVSEPLYVGPPGPEQYVLDVIVDDTSLTDTASGSASGGISLWGFSAGDLRGEFIIHAQTLDSGSMAGEAELNHTYSFSEVSGNSIGDPAGTFNSTETMTKALRTNQGLMFRISPSGVATEINKLFAPVKLDEVGTTTITKVGNLESHPAVITSTGTYGDGPTVQGLPTRVPSVSAFHFNTGQKKNWTRNYAAWPYPENSTVGPPESVQVLTYKPGALSGSGGYANTALAGCAMTPDFRTQYTGALFTALAEPTDPTTPIVFGIDRWAVEGVLFSPTYPDQVDPVDPLDTVPFPHRGSQGILLNPIFVGPTP